MFTFDPLRTVEFDVERLASSVRLPIRSECGPVALNRECPFPPIADIGSSMADRRANRALSSHEDRRVLGANWAERRH